MEGERSGRRAWRVGHAEGRERAVADAGPPEPAAPHGPLRADVVRLEVLREQRARDRERAEDLRTGRTDVDRRGAEVGEAGEAVGLIQRGDAEDVVERIGAGERRDDVVVVTDSVSSDRVLAV